MTDAAGRSGPMGRDPDERVPASSGLCAACVHARLVVSGRGSRFVLCGRSITDARFPRYPPLPVRACSGFEVAEVAEIAEAAEAGPDSPVPT